MILHLDINTRLELTALKHAAALFAAVDDNRRHLSRFLPWVGQMLSEQDMLQYLHQCRQLYQEGKEVSFVIFEGAELTGRIGLHHINNQNKHAAIGYWICENAQGRGIITRACQALISYGFQELRLHRIEIKAAVENIKSQAIPQKLGFKKEGTLRQTELVNGIFLDILVFSMLRNEWSAKPADFIKTI